MEKKVTLHFRKLARSMAKEKLDQAKITGYNRERTGLDGKKMPSVFANNWRDLAQQAAGLVKPRRKRGRK